MPDRRLTKRQRLERWLLTRGPLYRIALTAWRVQREIGDEAWAQMERDVDAAAAAADLSAIGAEIRAIRREGRVHTQLLALTIVVTAIGLGALLATGFGWF